MHFTNQQYFTSPKAEAPPYKNAMAAAALQAAVILIWFLLPGLPAFSQQADSTRNNDSIPRLDSTRYTNMFEILKEDILGKIKESSRMEAEKSIARYKEGQLETRQDELTERIKATTVAATNYIKIGLDTTGLKKEDLMIKKWQTIAGDGVFTNRGTSQTSRNLEVTRKILRELLSIMQARKSALDKYYRDLSAFRNELDSLNSDSSLYVISEDTATALRYIRKLLVLTTDIKPADSAFKQALLNASELQTKVNLTVQRLEASMEQVETFQKELSRRAFKREFTNILGQVGFSRPFSEIINFSIAKARIALYFYIANNLGKFFLLLALVFASTIFLRSLKKRIKEKGLLREDYTLQLVLRYPVLSAILIVFSLFQFIFPEPVFAFNVIIWAISGICLTIIFSRYITHYWMNSWLALFVLFLLTCLDNLILQASRPERWIMLGLAILGVIAFLMIIVGGHKKELKEKWIVYFLVLVGIMEFSSVIANIYGRYNLSKTLLTGGLLNVIIGILFLWTIRLINQGLSLASEVYQRQDRQLFYINFKKLGNKVPGIFYVFLFIGWGILFGRNFYQFRSISEPIHNFLTRERVVGDYSFTMKNLLDFFLIISISVIISKIVSFFASDHSESTTEKKGGIGSWLLLVRIAIISAGLFLAFAAAGIPTDRITIIISALGVGIGFGLQSLVNNLVSGLIISFEKPLNVGDIVEISGRGGVMKSIGFRSSVMYTWDGADVIIPNGDILNQHLVNWTLANMQKRVDVPVGVAYGTDLEKVKDILKSLIKQDERIMVSPTPSVQVKEFNNSSIDLMLYFWVRNIREWLAVRSDLLSAIDIEFKKNGIEIPFPQQDVHIRSDERNTKGAENRTESGNTFEQ